MREYFEVKWEEIEEIESLAQHVKQQQKRTAILYAFHGTPEGMTIGAERIGWEEVAQIVESSPSKYHLFLSCYSEEKITPSTKVVHGQKGQIDYSLAVIATINTIGAITANEQLVEQMYNYVFSTQYQLLFRTLVPVEPLWAGYTHTTQNQSTHFLLNYFALEKIVQIDWILKARGRSYIPSLIAEDMNRYYSDTDAEDEKIYAFTGINSIYVIPELLALPKHQRDIIFRHIAFDIQANVDISLLFPFSWMSIFSGEEWKNVTKVLTTLDSIDGKKDGSIKIQDNYEGQAVQGILHQFDVASRVAVTTPSDPQVWVKNLTNAMHFLQDIHVPYHTGLVGEDERVKTKLPVHITFNMKEEWKKAAVVALLPHVLSEPLYDHMHDFLFFFSQPNKSFNDWLKFLGNLAMSSSVAALLSGYYVANPWYFGLTCVAMGVFIGKVSSFGSSLYNTLQTIGDFNKEFKNQHNTFEKEANKHIIKASHDQQTKDELLSYLDESIVQSDIERWVKDWIGGNREKVLEEWIDKSFLQAQPLYDNLKQHNGFTKYAEEKMKEQLKRALVATYTMYKAFFINLIFVYDTDKDGIADVLEEKVFKTNKNDGRKMSKIQIRTTEQNSLSGVVTTACTINFALYPGNKPFKGMQVQLEIQEKGSGGIVKTTILKRTYSSSMMQNIKTINYYQQFTRTAFNLGISYIKITVTFIEYYYDWENIAQMLNKINTLHTTIYDNQNLKTRTQHVVYGEYTPGGLPLFR